MQTDRFSTSSRQATEAPVIRKNARDVPEAQRSQGDDSPRRQDRPARDEDDVGTLECFYD